MVSEPTLAVSRVGVGHVPSMYTDVCGSVRGHRGCPLALDAQTYTCVDWHYDIQSWPREEILVLCFVWVSWFDDSTRTSNSKEWVIVTTQPMGHCWARPVSGVL